MLHQKVSDFLHVKGLHDEWQQHPSFVSACNLLRIQYSGNTPRQKRKSAREKLVRLLEANK